MFSWILCGILLVTVLLLTVKIRLLQKGIDEIQTEFKKHLSEDTNTLISSTSHNAHLKKFAAEINLQLRLLRNERRRFQTGDRELKEAITNISHDLRTPLTAISGYMELLEKEEKSEAAARYVAVINNRTEAMKHLIEELFRYSVITASPEKVHFEYISLNATLEESISSYYVELKARAIEPKIIMPTEQIKSLLDKNILSRILGNLLNNAIKYSDGDLEITLSPTGKLTFTNTAATLNTVQVGKLFDRFYTVESARHATGLGLSIVKILVEQMDGHVSAAYANNKLTIELTFPLKDVYPQQTA
ncbi:sensor histidine kinase [Lysinibacillus agricola]|uniref:sensor histidine kinase n=1 Tax=Lysinibacillus agricola TaxID=2590012 RepID=UPI003C1B6099